MTRTHRLFGVEHEQFILHADGTPPSHGEMDELYALLCRRQFVIGYIDAQSRVLSVVRATEIGQVLVTNDCCTHVLEVVFPPSNDLDAFRRACREVFHTMLSVLGELGLAICRGAALHAPRQVFWRPKTNDPEGARLNDLLHRPTLDHPLFCAALPACITATQVSLNVTISDAIRRLPGYYQFEPLVPLLFGNSPEFQGVRGRCVRPLAWMANFAPSYLLLGVPETIPASLAEYEQMRQSSKLRDYSFVAIRGAERLEFRSACSQDTIDDVVLLVRFRLAVDRACDEFRAAPNASPRAEFVGACTTGPGPWCGPLFQRLVAIDPALEVLAERLDATRVPGAIGIATRTQAAS